MAPPGAATISRPFSADREFRLAARRRACAEEPSAPACGEIDAAPLQALHACGAALSSSADKDGLQALGRHCVKAVPKPGGIETPVLVEEGDLAGLPALACR